MNEWVEPDDSFIRAEFVDGCALDRNMQSPCILWTTPGERSYGIIASTRSTVEALLILPNAGTTEKILWIVVILLVVGYATGAWLNRRRSKALGTWLQAGLGSLGGRPTWRWIRSMTSGAEVTIADAARPFSKIQMAYFLLTREFSPLWGIERLRGKRDTLSVRAELRGQPSCEFEVVPLRGRLRRTLDRGAGDQPWQWREMPAGLGLATRGQTNGKDARAVAKFLERYGASVERLSLRVRQPNLILFVRLTGFEQAPLTEFLQAVRNVVGG